MDKAITDLSIALNSNRADAANYLTQLNAQAQKLGVTTQDMAKASDAWLRAGKNTKEATELTKNSMMLATLGQISAEESTRALLSSLNGFKKSASEAVDIIDKLTAVDAASASSAGGLATSISKAASAAGLASVSYDKLVGMIATISDVSQASAEEVGNAMKSILSRMNQIRAGKFLDAETGEALNDVEKVLNKIGITMRDTNNQFLNSETILDTIGKKWNTFDSIQQRAIATAIASTYQYNKFLNLMDNYDKVLNLTEVSLNSNGTALKKYNNYLESLEAKRNTLKSAFQSMVINSDFGKVTESIVEATTGLVKFIDKINGLKGVAVGALSGILIKGFMSLKTGISEAYLGLNQFNSALKISKQTQISTDSFERLNLLCKNLSASQLKLVLSSKALTTEQRVQLLVTSGLSKEEAILRLQSLNLLQSETGLAAGTMTLRNAMSGLWNTLLANPIGLIVTGITLAVSAFSSYNQKLEETKRKMIEASDAAKDEAKNIMGLYNAYGTASEAYHSNKGSKEELESATEALLEALGLEKSEIQNLVEEYGNLDNAIDSVTEKALEEKLSKMTAGLNEVKENLIDAVKDAKGDIGSFLNGEETDLNFGDVSGSSKYISAIKKAGIEGFEKSVYSHAMPGSPAQKIGTNYLVPLGDDFDTYEGIIEVYENLQKIKKALEDEIGKSYTREELTESDIYNDVTNRINAFEEEYEKVLEYNKEINQLVARQEYNKYVKKNGVPETREEFEALEKTLSDNADANGRFVGSQDEVKSAISDTLAEIPALAQFFDKLADSINKATDASEKNANSSTPQKFTKSNWESFVASDSEFQKQDENLIKLAEQGKLTIKVFEDTPNKQNILDHFGVSAEEAVDKLNSFIDRADQLSALGTNIRSLSDNLATKKENPNQGITSDVLAGMPEALKECTKEWAEYERVMMDATSGYDKCEEATNALATALFNNGNYLAGLTDETEKAYISDLKAMGIANAETVVKDALAQKTNRLKAEEEYLKLAKEDVTRITNGEITGLAKEKGWSDKLAESIRKVVFEKALFNKDSLKTSASIQNLINLAEQCKVTADVMADLTTLQSLMAELEQNKENGYKMNSNLVTAKEEEIRRLQSKIQFASTSGDIYVDEEPVKVDIDYKNDYTKNKKEKSTKQKAKETKTTIDWIARSLKVLQDKIDLTKAKFDNLFGYNRKKNNLLKQIKEQKILIEQTTRAVKAYQKETDKAFKNLGKKVKVTTTVKGSSGNGSANDLASIAAQELGYHEYSKNGKSNGNKYGKSFGNEFDRWCEYFVSWVSKKAGLSGKTYLGGSVGTAMQWFDDHGMFGKKGSYTPQRNDTVIFKSAGRSHAAIVEKVENGKIHTIEGNTGTNNVARRSYSLNDKTITGYGKTSKYFDSSSGTTTTTKTKKVKFTQDQINYIKQLVTNYNTSDKALMKSMVIKKYGEKQGKLINAYIDSFDKLSDVKKSLETEIKTLHDLYGELRDLKLEYNEKRRNKYEAQYENKTTFSSKNKLIDKEIDLYKSDNKVQDNYLTRLKKDRTAQAKVVKASVKKIKTTKKNTSKGITKALKNKINALIKQRKKIPSSILKKVKKASQTAYDDLLDYNNEVDDVIEAKIDVDTAKEQNKTNIREKKIEKQQNIQGEADSNISKLEAQAEIARDEKGNATAKEKNKYLKEQVKWIRKSYNAQINQAKIEGNTALVEELRAKKQKELLDNQIERKQNLADEADAQIGLYEAQADNVYTAKEKIELYKKELSPLETQYKKLIEIAELEGNATEAERLRAEYTGKVAENLKKQVDAINTELSNKNGLIDNGIDTIQSIIDLAEARGDAINKEIYSSLMDYANGKRENDLIVKADLEERLSDPNLTGDNWYTTMSDYSNVLKDIAAEEKQIWEWQKAMNEIDLKPFEKLADKLDFITDEFDFMLDIIQDGNDLFDEDNGSITDAGLASFAVHFDQMDLAKEKVQNYKYELEKVNELYKSGKMSLEDYTEQTENLTRKIWDSTKATLEQKDAIIQMVKDGLDAQLSALDKMIEKYKKALSNEKDLYEYQRNIAKQTKNIANIQKQIDTLSGDSSDEARSKIQKLKVQLEEAQDELKDTEYNKWYEDQTNMLDDMRDEISDAFDDIIKNHREEILNNLIPVIKNSSSNELIKKFMDNVYYNPTSDVNSILSNQGTINSTVVDIKDRINEYLTDFKAFNKDMTNLTYLLSKVDSSSSQYGSGDGGNETDGKNTNLDSNKFSDNNNTTTNTYSSSDLIPYITSNTKPTDSDTPTDTAFGHQLNDYLNKNFGQALTADKEKTAYEMLKSLLALPDNTDEGTIVLKAIQSGLFNDLSGLFNEDSMTQAIVNGQRTTGNETSTALTPSDVRLIRAVDTNNKNSVSNAVYGKVETYLNKKLVNVEDKDGKDYKSAKDLMNKYKSAARIYHTWSSKFALTSEDQLLHIAKLMGATKDNKIDDSTLYKKLVASGFKTGGIARLVKRAGEDGIGLFRNGEGFVMPEHVPQIQELLKNIPQANMIMEDLNRKFALPVSGKNGNVGGMNVNIGDINIDAPNVTDAKSLVAEIKGSPELQNAIASATAGRIGKKYMNSLSRF